LNGLNNQKDCENCESDEKSLKGELLRKCIHLAGLGYIPFYILTGRLTTLVAITFLTLIAILIEFLRRRDEIFPGWILRSYERRGTGAYVYFGISMLIVTLLFSPQASFVAIACGSAGDGIAGIVKRFWRGMASISMFLSSVTVILVVSIEISLSLPAAILATIFATAVEAKLQRIGKYYINDNLSVPLVAAAVYELFIVFAGFW
jgi:dolichol kinase